MEYLDDILNTQFMGFFFRMKEYVLVYDAKNATYSSLGSILKAKVKIYTPLCMKNTRVTEKRFFAPTRIRGKTL